MIFPYHLAFPVDDGPPGDARSLMMFSLLLLAAKAGSGDSRDCRIFG
jgi:hypothetical protein